MADTLAEGAPSSLSDLLGGIWGPYWSDVSTAVIIFADAGVDISFVRTTDKGATWSTTEIEAGATRHLPLGTTKRRLETQVHLFTLPG